MAIRIIDGVPRSGKSYYGVNHLAKNYFKKVDGVLVLDKKVVIITNIEDFVPHSLDLDDEIEKAGSVHEFFSIQYQEKYKEGKPQIIYMIDEAARKFRKGDRKLEHVFSYMEYHAHWGQEIYLFVQNYKKLPPDITLLSEYIVKALPRVRSISKNVLKYHWYNDGDLIKTETLTKKQEIFDLYKSQDTKEVENITNPLIRKVILLFATAIFIIGSGLWYLKASFNNKMSVQEEKISQTVNESKNNNMFVDALPIIGESSRVEPVLLPVEILIPVSSVTQTLKGRIRVMLVWGGELLDMSNFPYELTNMSGIWYAIMDKDLYDYMFPEGVYRRIVRLKKEVRPEG